MANPLLHLYNPFLLYLNDLPTAWLRGRVLTMGIASEADKSRVHDCNDGGTKGQGDGRGVKV